MMQLNWLHQTGYASLEMAKLFVRMFALPTYQDAESWPAVQRAIAERCLPVLPGFLFLSSLLSLVIIRIVTVTAQSYGLSEFALEVLVRTLVLELLPLYSAIFVALRISLPDRTNHTDIAQAWAGLLASLLFTGLASLLAATLAYLMVYGLSPWGLASYIGAIGKIFTPAMSFIFLLKTLAFSLAVALLPAGLAKANELQAFTRLIALLLLVEVVSLVGNYA
jgi:phospholipid/cholesterol/gamma-HCH transport system permease protein